MASHQPSHDYLTRLIIPALSLAAAIISLVKDQPHLAGFLAGITLLSIMFSVVLPFAGWITGWRKMRQDDQISRQVWPDLMVLVEQFGRFIDQGRSDSLHGIVLAYSSPSHLAVGQIARQNDFVPSSVLWGPWDQIAHSQQNSRPNRLRLQELTALFTWLIGTYHYHVIQAVFARGASALEPHLTPQIKRDLATSRETVVRFEADYKN